MKEINVITQLDWIHTDAVANMTVNDVTDHYIYWQEHFDHNHNDCCNLRNSKATKQIFEEKKKGRLF